MGRWAEVLLVTMLVLTIVFAKQAEAMVKQCPVSASSVAPLSVSNPVQSDTSDILTVRPMPGTPLKIPSYMVADFPPESFCIRFAQHQRRLVTCNNGYGFFLAKSGSGAVFQDGRTKPSFIAPLLRSFDSFSPPGLVMRL
ncbi:MAG: hypothetical protein PHI12_00200 [Dehalococcoidales bacterium]|nr:hypothetical protein [Dehalococcoidales bacterium]